MPYPQVVNGVPILQQFYASKYVGVATLTFDDMDGTLTGSTGNSVPLGTYFDAAGMKFSGALTHTVYLFSLHGCICALVIKSSMKRFASE